MLRHHYSDETADYGHLRTEDTLDQFSPQSIPKKLLHVIAKAVAPTPHPRCTSLQHPRSDKEIYQQRGRYHTTQLDTLYFPSLQETYMMKIPEDVEQMLEQHTASFSFTTKEQSLKYLADVLRGIFKDSMQLKFVTQLIQTNNEQCFTEYKISYTLHRM